MLDTGFIVMNLAKSPKAKQVSMLIIYINNHLFNNQLFNNQAFNINSVHYLK